MKIAKDISPRTVAMELGISTNRISEILSKFQGTGSVSDQPRTSCIRKLQHWMIRKLVSTTKYQPKKTARQDQCYLSNLVLVDAKKCIIRQHEVKKSALTKIHLKSRLSWLKSYEL